MPIKLGKAFKYKYERIVGDKKRMHDNNFNFFLFTLLII